MYLFDRITSRTASDPRVPIEYIEQISCEQIESIETKHLLFHLLILFDSQSSFLFQLLHSFTLLLQIKRIKSFLCFYSYPLGFAFSDMLFQYLWVCMYVDWVDVFMDCMYVHCKVEKVKHPQEILEPGLFWSITSNCYLDLFL